MKTWRRASGTKDDLRTFHWRREEGKAKHRGVGDAQGGRLRSERLRILTMGAVIRVMRCGTSLLRDLKFVRRVGLGMAMGFRDLHFGRRRTERLTKLRGGAQR